jgi:alpha-ketoglutarate-dependent taurine dioxygenase
MGSTPEIRLAAAKEGTLPRLVTPATPLTANDWTARIERNRSWIADNLARHGALLFRGFSVNNAQAMNAFCRAAALELMGYPRGATPRHSIQGLVFTATDAPPAMPLPLHNEMSYSPVYPLAVALCCETAPSRRGQTPIADMVRVARRLPSELVERFESRGICYRQRVPSDERRSRRKSWQQMFDTRDREQAEAICAEQEIEVRWIDDMLQLTNVRPATLVHPCTGDSVWFNQAHVFHSSFSAELFRERKWLAWLLVRTYEFARQTFPRQLSDYRFDCCYGDGTPIDRATMMQIRRAVWEESTLFGWQRGDLLLLDNLRIAHGRESFHGERRVLAALVSAING